MMFKGKIVAITGAAGGIGQSLCRYFAARARRSRPSTGAQALEASAGELGATASRRRMPWPISATRTPWRRPSQRCLRALGAVDILVNNAGFSAHPTFARTDPESWQHEVNGNLNGAYYCAHAVIAGDEGEGRRHRSSPSARSTASARWAIRPTARPRPGMISLTRSLAHGIWPLQHPLQHRACRARCARPVGAAARPRTQRCWRRCAVVSARPHRRSGRRGDGRGLPCLRCRRARSPAWRCPSIAD